MYTTAFFPSPRCRCAMYGHKSSAYSKSPTPKNNLIISMDRKAKPSTPQASTKKLSNSPSSEPPAPKKARLPPDGHKHAHGACTHTTCARSPSGHPTHHYPRRTADNLPSTSLLYSPREGSTCPSYLPPRPCPPAQLSKSRIR